MAVILGRSPYTSRVARDGEADRMTATLRFVRHHALTAYAMLVFAYLLVPIAIVILFSFNAPHGRFNYTWQGFTLDNWRHWDAVPGSGARSSSLWRWQR
jgi:ABC-type spermidine/putrescine transport system permease subunit II